MNETIKNRLEGSYNRLVGISQEYSVSDSYECASEMQWLGRVLERLRSHSQTSIAEIESLELDIDKFERKYFSEYLPIYD